MVHIVVDSGCDLTEEMRNSADFSQVPLNLQLGETCFVDDFDLNLDEYLNQMEAYPRTPQTSAPSPERYLEKFKGTASTFAVTLSSQLSSSYSSALLARQMYLDEIGNKFIHVFDSFSASVGETLIALKIQEYAKKNLPDHEIVDSVNRFIHNMKTYFILEKYDNLVKTGRMNAYAAKIASLLNIKAICAGVDGKPQFVDQARGYKKAFKKLVDRMKQEEDLTNRILGITHVRCPEKALAFKEEVMQHVQFKQIFITEASGLCSTYANREGLILAY